MKRVGIIGCGTIGSRLAAALARDYGGVARIVALTDRTHAYARELQQQVVPRPAIVSLPELVRRSDLILEAASTSVAATVARLALRAHRDVLVMSTGGLLTSRAWQSSARRSRGHLYVPSGALCGLDGIKAMSVGTVRRIRLTTSKPPRALAAAPFVQRRRLRLDRLRRPMVVFEGSPSEVVRAFPQNTNVAATATLAHLFASHPRRVASVTMVRVVADPSLTVNRHELEVEGDCGRVRCVVESRPSATNPKTSELAVRSALATLKELFEPVRIGT